jgi:hypothetical protein
MKGLISDKDVVSWSRVGTTQRRALAAASGAGLDISHKSRMRWEWRGVGG